MVLKIFISINFEHLKMIQKNKDKNSVWTKKTTEEIFPIVIIPSNVSLHAIDVLGYILFELNI